MIHMQAATSSTRSPYFCEESWPGDDRSPMGRNNCAAGMKTFTATKNNSLRNISSHWAQLPKAESKNSQCPDQAPAHWPQYIQSKHAHVVPSKLIAQGKEASESSVRELWPRNTESNGAEAESCFDKLMWPFCEWVRECVSCERECHHCWVQVYVRHWNTSSTQPVA